MKYTPTPKQKAMIDKVYNFNTDEKDICICCKCAANSIYEEEYNYIGCVYRLKNLLSVYGINEEEYTTTNKPSDRFSYFNCAEAYKDLFLKVFSKKHRMLKI